MNVIGWITIMILGKNFSEYYTSENLNLDLDLFEARMNASLQKTRVMVDKTIAEKSKDPKKRAEYKNICCE